MCYDNLTNTFSNLNFDEISFQIDNYRCHNTQYNILNLSITAKELTKTLFFNLIIEKLFYFI